MVANTPPGPAIDASGQAVIDPSKNVEMRVEREVQRLDDMATLRSYYTEKIDELRAVHAKELSEKEAARIDAIRAVDAASAREQAAAAEARAATLAGQVQAAADAMRTTVEGARVAASESQAVALSPIQEAIANVQRFQYEAVGQKTQVVETQARGGSVGLWVGIAVGAVSLFVSLLAVSVTIAVLLTR